MFFKVTLNWAGRHKACDMKFTYICFWLASLGVKSTAQRNLKYVSGLGLGLGYGLVTVMVLLLAHKNVGVDIQNHLFNTL